ncbi:glycoside hydrolase family 2 TIM barrel-domain containing protein [Kribbella speibonae]|uniref:Glycoside hydrolase family 2 protein n=1 Tax=Kribbella speibonae TaxID=1572660 RepID=A0A4R0IUG9_9ACTN|nr:glycoside hydrolase family 2 TIM barrel-domain containing protein [Kribbella speibonae]TCC36410.1 glycoside hydrolase family 2 protein [Kribbella speibonae]
MKRLPFNDGWQFRQKVNPFDELSGAVPPYVDVFVPHDAMIERERDPQGDRAAAYFPGGTYEYRKTFDVPEEFEGKRIVLEFEGVYRDAAVYLNGDFAGHRPYGYSLFTIEADEFLRPGEENVIRVECRNGQDSRWYTGAGIYRDVWLHIGSQIHIPAHGLRASAPDIDDVGALVEVAVQVANTSNRRTTVDVAVSVVNPGGAEVAAGVVPVTVSPNGTSLSRQRLYIRAPERWSAESPVLYTAEARIIRDGTTLDETAATFGIRRIQVDPVNGLRVNGETVKLRGACIHHDNGILGAATIPAADERRVRLLKQAGFNALRSAHNPMSVALLEACDRLGMFVIDETFDMWTAPKMDHDYSLVFPEWWERDVEALIAKDYNHPSVLMYSIGNEVTETGTPAGGLIGRALAEKVRSLDPTRFVTNAVNGLLAVMDDAKKIAAQRGGDADDGTGINTLMAGPIEIMNEISASPLVTEKTAESFGLLDIAGMNYVDSRYALDNELFPNRIIVGTETFPTTIDRTWALVTEHAHVIGDFTWTGFDYLGEVGLGRAQYLAEGEPASEAPYPWIAGWCGDLDLIGGRRPASYYREIVFGLRREPYVAVRRPGEDGKLVSTGPWAWSDSIGSWTWTGHEGRSLGVEVYSDAEQVELAVNGRVIGSAPAGRANRYTAVFDVPFESGTLTATSIRDGDRAESFSLATATGQLRLAIRVEDAGITDQYRFARLAVVDSDGTVFTDADRQVEVEVIGSAELVALGTGNPAPPETYGAARHTTFDGRALVIIRRTGSGEVVIRVSAEGCDPAVVSLQGA